MADVNCIRLKSIFLLVRHIQNEKDRVIEGELRSKQLNTYLEKIECPKSIFLSEDASGVVQLVGLVLPFNSTNGMPNMLSFEAKSAEDIEKYLKLPKSTLVYIIVAQPLRTGAAPFILQIFGTNNKFKTPDVLRRWSHTEMELKK